MSKEGSRTAWKHLRYQWRRVRSVPSLTLTAAVLFATWLGWGLIRVGLPVVLGNAGLRKEDKYAPPPWSPLYSAENKTKWIQRTGYRKEVIKIPREEYIGGRCFFCFVQVVVVMEEELAWKASPFLVPAAGPLSLVNTPFTHLQPY